MEFVPLADASDDTDAFFSGHRVVFGDPNLSMKLPGQSQVIHCVRGTGFRIDGALLLPKEEPRLAKKAKKISTTNALEALAFEEKGIESFQPGDIILPGISNQSFCDFAVVFELSWGDGEVAKCINFTQMKFWEKEEAAAAARKLTVAEVVSTLAEQTTQRIIRLSFR